MNFSIEGTRSPLRQNSVCYKRMDTLISYVDVLGECNFAMMTSAGRRTFSAELIKSDIIHLRMKLEIVF